MFFDFMRTAYQVNESFEDLANTLTANSEIDWSALAKVSLTLEDEEKNKKQQDNSKENKSFQTNISKVCLLNIFKKSLNDTLRLDKLYFNQESRTPDPIQCTIVPLSESNNILENEEKPQNFINLKESTENYETLHVSSNDHCVKQSKSLSFLGSTENKKEPLLSTVMKRCLSDVLHEGLLDSVLPYMVPKPILSQPVIKKSIILEPKKSASVHNIEQKVITAIPNNHEKDKDKNKQKKTAE